MIRGVSRLRLPTAKSGLHHAQSCHRQVPRVKTITRATGFDSNSKRARPIDAAAAEQLKNNASATLVELMQSPDPVAKADQIVEKFDNTFFMVTNSYLQMAKKESKTEVYDDLVKAMQIAMAAKNKTLRPELRLLNTLLGEESGEMRTEILKDPETLETLKSDDGFFFKVIDRMVGDVSKQRDSSKKTGLLTLLSSIREVATEIVGL